MLSERKDGKTFHLEKYQKFTPSGTSFLTAPQDTGCPVASAAMNGQLENTPILLLALPRAE